MRQERVLVGLAVLLWLCACLGRAADPTFGHVCLMDSVATSGQCYHDMRCDEIDPEKTDGLFVDPHLGDDSNSGDQLHPMRTFETAYAKAVEGDLDLFLGPGAYSVDETIELVGGVNIFGGYNGPPDWNRGHAEEYTSAIYSTANPVFTGSEIYRGTVVEWVSIYQADVEEAELLAGQSTYVFQLSECYGLVLRKVVMSARQPPHGTGGHEEDTAAAEGRAGLLGQGGCQYECTESCSTPEGGEGGRSLCGAHGGKGGDAGRHGHSGEDGSAGEGPNGRGGAGGEKIGDGKGDSYIPSETHLGVNGTSGNDGRNGVAGTFTFTDLGWLATDGTNGSDGEIGGGGGGGAGGGGGTRTLVCNTYGAAGGGGGAGGCAGGGGGGGKSGASSFGVYAWRSEVLIEYCDIRTANAGHGGNGGAGQRGGEGAEGASRVGEMTGGWAVGNSHGHHQGSGSNGAAGGRGGDGGNGGDGGGGVGGWSVGVTFGGGGALVQRCNIFSLGTHGDGGYSPGAPGVAGAAFACFDADRFVEVNCSQDCYYECSHESFSDDFAYCDACGVCGGNNSTCAGCDGVAYSGLVVDECGVCGGDSSSCSGCDGGTAQLDLCGVCDGDNSTCSDCRGVPNGNAVVDPCGVCEGDGSQCADCLGVPNGLAVYDSCGVCGGDGQSCLRSSDSFSSTYSSVSKSSVPSVSSKGSPGTTESPASPGSSAFASSLLSSVMEDSSGRAEDEEDDAADAFPWIAVVTVSIAITLLLLIVAIGTVAVAVRLYMHRARRHTILQEFQREMVTYAGDDLTTGET